MDTATLVLVILMTLMFFAAIVWMAIYSRRSKQSENSAEASKAIGEG